MTIAKRSACPLVGWARVCRGLGLGSGRQKPMMRHEVLRRTRGRRWRAGVTLAGPLATGIVLTIQPLISGCASRSPAEAENREIRLTQDGLVKYAPHFSPDGASLVYAARHGEGAGALGVYVVPRKGGEPRRISPDSLSIYPLGWSDDGGAIYCRSIEGRNIYRVGLDGSMRTLDSGDPFSRVVSVSPDGRTFLLLKFNKDNRDLGIVEAGSPFRFVAETPVWEEDAVFGPAAGEITVVSTAAPSRGPEVPAGLVGRRPDARLLLPARGPG
ncbi:MAG: hypothetical protein DMD82_03320 [Candidatus Rokuibacteriota bacterium]|nr:MAG: hypothetical protein DMD82_03320 [Candidatus Rokubacteria bacterium]